MTTRTTSAHQNALLLGIHRGLEGLWLLTVFLVPLAFLDRDSIYTETVIGYVEVPKVALLRTLASLIAILWMLEWVIQGRMSRAFLFQNKSLFCNPIKWPPSLKTWLRTQPSRWLVLAALFFLFTTLLSTILSTSFSVSVWGEVPGQDSYAAYTTAAYVVMFAVIATHLRTSSQLWRLLGTIAVMGTLVSGYGIFQHYGNDFLNLTEFTGGGARRVTSFMGNAIFAAATMLMTIPITLVLAAVSLSGQQAPDDETRRDTGRWGIVAVTLAFWGAVLAVQILGLMFTFSRGPWLGTAIAMLVLLISIAVFVGWRAIGRASIILGLSAVLAGLLIWSQGTISIFGMPTFLIAIIALAAFLGAVTIIMHWERFGRVVALVGFGSAIAIAVIFAIVSIRGDGAPSIMSEGPERDTTASQITGRIASVKGEVEGGLIGGRRTHFEVSWEIIQNHPWPISQFDNLSISWLRPLVGYGPDMFRFGYLLRSPPEGRNLLPLEPDHAHNFFIHHAVSQGFLGLLSSLSIFAAAFWVGGGLLLRGALRLSDTHKLIILGLLAVLVGRFLEMMVGVARISDLTILWAVLGVLAALPTVMGSYRYEAPERQTAPAQGRGSEKGSAGKGVRHSSRNTKSALFVRLALVAPLIGVIGFVVLAKNVNNVRAGMAVSDGVRYFQEGNLQTSLKSFDRAIELAPDLSVNYNHRANVYQAFQIRGAGPLESECDAQSELPYRICLAAQNFENNAEAARRRPLYYRHQLALGDSAFNIAQYDLAAMFYQRALALIPMSWQIRNELAVAYLEAGRPEEALQAVSESLDITADTLNSSRASYLLGLVYRDLGDLEKSAASMQTGLELSLSGDMARQANLVIAEHHLDSNRFDDALTSVDKAISIAPNDPEAHAARGIALSNLERYHSAVQAFEKALSIDPEYQVDLANFGMSYFWLDRFSEALLVLDRALGLNPGDAMSLAYRGVSQHTLGRSDLAFEDLNKAVSIDPLRSEIYYLRGLVNLSVNSLEAASRDLNAAIQIDSEKPRYHIASGQILAASGQSLPAKEQYAVAINLLSTAEQVQPDATFKELDNLVLQSPEDAKVYQNRGDAYYQIGEYQSAIDDYSRAIPLDRTTYEPSLSRGLAYHALGLYALAVEDYNVAIDSILPRQYEAASPPPEFFNVYFNRGLLNFDTKAYEDAAKDMGIAMYFDHPDLAEAFVIRGIAYGKMGQPENAVADLLQQPLAIENLQRAFSLNPDKSNVYFTRGLAYLNLDQPLLATAYFDEALRLDPEDHLALMERGRAYSDLGDYQQAIRDLEAAIALEPDNDEAYFNLGLTSYRAGSLQGGFDALAEAISLNTSTQTLEGPELPSSLNMARKANLALTEFHDPYEFYLPGDPEAHAARGVALSNLERYHSAVQAFEKALSIDPEYQVDFANLGMSYFWLDRFSEALPVLDRAVTLDPEDAKSLTYRGVTHHELGRNDLAFYDLDRAVSIDPLHSEARYLRGLVNLSLNSLEAATQDLDEAILIDTTEPKYHIAKGHILNASGKTLKTTRRISDTHKLIMMGVAILQNPKDAKVYENRADAYYQLGDYQLAIDDYSQAIPLDPSDSNLSINRGKAYHALGLYDRAIADFDIVVDAIKAYMYLRFPEYFSVYFTRGLLHFNQNHYQNAVKDLNTAMEFDHPDLAEAFVIRGIAYGKMGQPENAVADLLQQPLAIENLQRAFSLNPDKSNVYFTRGLAYLNLDQPSSATAYFDEALRLDPEDHLALMERGRAYSDLGDYQQAIRDLEAAIALEPDNDEAYFNLGLTSYRAGSLQGGFDALAEAMRLNFARSKEYLNRAITDGFPDNEANLVRLKVAISLEPKNDEAYFDLGLVYRDLGDLEKSAASMQAGLELSLSGEMARRANLVVAEHHFDSNRFDDALTSVDKAISIAPNDPEAHAARGIALSNLERYHSAVQAFEKALSIDPEYQVDLANFGMSYFWLDRFSEALLVLDRAVTLDPQDARSLAYRGVTHHELGRNDLAFYDLDKAVSIDPMRSETRYLRGLVNLSLNSLEAASRDLDEAILIDATESKYRVARGHILNASGQTLQAQEEYAIGIKLLSPEDPGQFDAQLEEMNAAILQNPEDAKVYQNRGDAYYQLGEYQSAIADYSRAIPLDPSNSDSSFSRGQAYQALGLYDRAIADFDIAVDAIKGYIYMGSPWIGESPKYFILYFSRGLLHFNQNHYENAVRDLTTAMEFDHPDLAEAFVIRGIAYEKMGQTADAVADLLQQPLAIQNLQRAFSLNPDKSNVYFTRGLAYLNLDQPLLATTYFNEALRLDPEDHLALMERGKAYSDLGD